MSALSTSIIIRRMRESDLEAASAIETVSFPGRDRWEITPEDLESAFYCFFVAEDTISLRNKEHALLHPSVVGLIGLWKLNEELHIMSLAVQPQWRKQGIGGRLLWRALRWGQEVGATRASLDVRRSNRAAILLYQSLGFVVTGIRPRYYLDNDEDALVMWANDLWGPEWAFRLRRAEGLFSSTVC